MFLTLRSKLIVLFLILSMGPLLIVGLVLSVQTYNLQVEQALDLEKEIALRISSEFYSFISELEDKLMFIVKIGQINTLSKERQYDMLSSLLAHENMFEEIFYLDSRGDEIINIHQYEIHTAIDLGNRADESYFQLTRNNRKTYFGSVEFSEISGEPIMLIAYPVIDNMDNSFQGVVIGAARLKPIWNLLADLADKEGDNLFILDLNNRVVAHPNPSIVLRSTYYSINEERSYNIKGLNGESVISIMHNVIFGDQIFHVVAQWEIRRALATAKRTIRIILTIVILTLLITGFILIYVLNLVISPIKHLAEVAKDIASGNLERKAVVRKNDEVGLLSLSFNQMTGYLTSAMENLEREIEIRREAEQKSSHLQNLLNNIVNSMPSILIGVDKQGLVTLWNNKAEIETGLPQDDALGKSFATLIPSLTDKMSKILASIRDDKVYYEEKVESRINDNKKISDITIYPLSNNGIAGSVIRIDDVTEKTKLEENYLQAQKVDSIGRLAGGVAHDLNNLLVPIIGFSELIMDEPAVDEESRKSAGQIFEAGIRARDLVQQLLAYSRKQTLQYIPVDLNSILDEFENLLRRTIREDIHINIIRDPRLSLIKADRGQLEQVIMNLSINAQDAMPLGGSLEIKTEQKSFHDEFIIDSESVPQGDYVILSIGDNGRGIDQEVQKHMFEPFYSTKGTQGTGLGLATVFGIIKQLKGFIHVTSALDRGTLFKIYFPVSDTEPLVKENKKEINKSIGGEETILLVEDNQQVLDLTERILRRYNYHLLIAHNGEEALTILKNEKNPVHLLLTDVIMPGMNGKDLYSHALNLIPGLRVLFMSGYTNDVVAEHGLVEGGLDFIQKPFSSQSIIEKIRSVLDR